MADLLERIVAEIRRDGPITFGRYMELALYDPEEGFFARPPVGPGAHFVTSPHISPVFADCIAEQVRDTHHALGGDPIDYVELGAGDGTLIRAVRERVGDLLGRAVAVEWSAQARAALGSDPGAGIEGVATIAEVGRIRGLVVANELLDNIPFRRFRVTEAGVREVRVGEVEGRLREFEADPDAPVPIPPGAREWVRAPAIATLVSDLARTHETGHALFIDYGWRGEEPIEPVRGYRAQRLVDDLLAEPGATDITGPVDFDDFARLAMGAGYEVARPATQREALYALGYRRHVDRLRAAQTAAEAAGQHRRAIELFGERNEAATLVLEGGLGSLKVCALATAGLGPPKAVRAGR